MFITKILLNQKETYLSLLVYFDLEVSKSNFVGRQSLMSILSSKRVHYPLLLRFYRTTQEVDALLTFTSHLLFELSIIGHCCAILHTPLDDHLVIQLQYNLDTVWASTLLYFVTWKLQSIHQLVMFGFMQHMET